MLARDLMVLLGLWLALNRAAGADTLLHERTVRTDQYRISYWTSEQGLPQNTVTCLLQTHEGYLWIGTRHGLARFDGVRLADYSAQLIDAQTASLDVRDLAEDSQGRLWVQVRQDLVCYHQGRFRCYTLPSTAGIGGLQGIAAGGDGSLWVAGRHGLLRFAAGQAGPVLALGKELPCAYGQPLNEMINDLAEDPQGQLWVRSTRWPQSRWWRLDPSRQAGRFLDELVGQEAAEIGGVCWDRAGRMWLAGRGRLWSWEKGQVSTYSANDAWGQNAVKQIVEDGRGHLWIATEGSLQLHRFADGQILTFGRAGLPEINDVRCLCADREGNLWVGTGGNGLYRVQPRQLVALLTGSKSALKEIYSVAPGQNGRVWLATEDGLVKFQAGQFNLYTNPVPPDPNTKRIRPVLELSSGEVVFGLDFDGLKKLEGDTFMGLPAVVPSEGQRRLIHSLAEDAQGTLWLATPQGLVERRTTGWRTWTTAEGLADNHTFGLVCAANGAVWVGSLQSGIHEFRNGRFRQYTTNDGLLSQNAWPLRAEPDGSVWVGTPAGLNRIRGAQVGAVTQQQGLYENLAYCLLADRRGNYWGMGNRGIWRARRQDLHAVADRRASQVYCVSYGETDGMASVEGNGDQQPNAALLPNGELWFPTTRGVVILDPDHLRDNQVPPTAVIEEVLVDDERIYQDGGYLGPTSQAWLSSQPLRLNPGRARVLEIRYTATTFVDSEKTRFRYRLEGYEAVWHEADHRRVAFYTNLRPGQYRFRVEACNHHGCWSRGPAEFAFELAPHFYQTWLFYLLCAAAGALGLGSWHLRRLQASQRVSRLERDHALEAERTRIARDLHDDLGANLTGIALQIEGTCAQATPGPVVQERLQTVAGSIRGLVHRMREVIWSLNPQCDTLDSFCAYLGQYAESFLADARIRCRLDLPEEVPPAGMSAEVRYHLFLVAKEALHNAAKHARASEVQVELRLEMARRIPQLTLVIADNGRGFDPATTAGALAGAERAISSPRPGRGGCGLFNMRQRVAALGGRLELASHPGQGTSIRAVIPLNKA